MAAHARLPAGVGLVVSEPSPAPPGKHRGVDAENKLIWLHKQMFMHIAWLRSVPLTVVDEACHATLIDLGLRLPCFGCCFISRQQHKIVFNQLFT